MNKLLKIIKKLSIIIIIVEYTKTKFFIKIYIIQDLSHVKMKKNCTLNLKTHLTIILTKVQAKFSKKTQKIKIMKIITIIYNKLIIITIIKLII